MSTTVHTLTFQCPYCKTTVEVNPLEKNEVLLCPNEACGKPFQISLPVAKPVQDANGEHGGVPAPVTIPPLSEGGDGPPKPAAPVAAPAKDSEDVIGLVRLDPFRRYPLRILGYGAAVAAGC